MNTHRQGSCLALMLIAILFSGCTQENPRVATKLNAAASLPASLPWNPLQGRVITSWVTPQNATTPATMSTLYGNDAAIEHARTSAQSAYPAGATLSLVTWTQQEDERWFGANIPAAPQSVEFLTVSTRLDKSLQYSYKKFEGNPLQQTSTEESPAPGARAQLLLSQRAAVMP